MCITEDKLVESYGKATPRERFRLIYKNYSIFPQLVDCYETGLFNRILFEVEYNRRKKDDVITPGAIEYDYKLMFEDRTISVLTYNKETLLAEKMQTIINRGIANTRLRDFYDVYSIMSFYGEQIEKRILYDAFSATCEKRKTIFSKDNIEATLHLISDDLQMEELWAQFQKSNFYVGDLAWKM